MNRAGRKPMGPALVQHLEGSERAKRRLEVILATISGQITVDEACTRLAIGPSRFYKMRTEVLEASLEYLEPRPMGRPAHVETAEETKCTELQQQLEQLQAELKLSQVREEIARAMPHMAEENEPQKKPNTPRRPGKKLAQSAANATTSVGYCDGQGRRQTHEQAERGFAQTHRQSF